ncbi:SRPBCC family protein [Qaidamihabitans albus]|uniref:SRPBCC family protein n=1 Tax=Qaidamihabitans albus TaxID=2795733 RepID=UPI0018F227DE|nr:SRPBCC family protein [Qaidamihabitans albus]
MIDVDHQISAVRRQVGSRTLEAGEARTVTVRQTYDATVEDVWDACTNPERIPRWFMPVSGELRLHGRFQIENNAAGTIEQCDPPKSFAATWEYGGEVSWIEVRLAAAPEGGTRFELEHVAHVDDERWAEFGPGAVGIGWDLALMGLALHLSSGESAEDQDTMAWMMSEQGGRFMAASSERWYEASVAAGTAPEAARAAADRTTAAYTAEPSESSESSEDAEGPKADAT